MTSRREFLALTPALLAGCAGVRGLGAPEPIVFVHGNGDNASVWQTTLWRFESNGWPRDRLHAIDMPYPLARDDDAKFQPGRSSIAEFTDFVQAQVAQALRLAGAKQVVLFAISSGGYAVRNYIQNGPGGPAVSHAILSGVPNHGVQAVPGRTEGSEFSGTGPFVTGLNKPKDAAGDEVVGPVKWLTIRSDHNDKYAQPDGRWLGDPKLVTHVGYDGPALKGATNVVLPGVDHRETAFSPQAFDAAWRFITGNAPRTLEVASEPRIVLAGKVFGLGVSSVDRFSGNFPNNLPLPGASLELFAVDPATGERRGAAVHAQTIAPSGDWGPFQAQPGTPYEFVLAANGYATTHVYRSPFPRSSGIVNLRPERVAEAELAAPALVILTRPRGYFDPARDRMSFDGQTPPPGVRPGAGDSSSRIRPAGPPRAIVAEFNGERIVGRNWPLEGGHVSVIELTY
jgi:triacylglycerol lipase